MSKQRLDSGQQLLAAARGDHAPSQLERAAVRRALAARIAQVDVPPPAAGGGGLRTIGAVKLWVIGGFVSLATLGMIGGVMGTRRAAVMPPAVSASVDTREKAPAHVDEHVHANVDEREVAATPREVAPARARAKPAPRIAQRGRPASVASTQVGTRTQGAASDPVATQDGAARGSEPGPGTTQTEAAAAPRESSRTPERELRAREPDRHAPAPARPTPADRTPPVSELAVMQRIQAALRADDPQLALELSVEHERRWPHGQFQEEREGVRAFATCQLHLSEGRARANTFLQHHPQSALAPRVRKACQLPAQPVTR